MLNTLSIRNVVLIDKLDLDFKSGLSVLTGETGAGKSILLDSLGLVLGNRAETGLIRLGEDKLNVTADFFYPQPHAEFLQLLDEFDLEYNENIVIKRSLDRNGKGKIFFNDEPISAKLLKEIGKYLVEVHGQFDNQGLLNPANHLSVLDGYGDYKNLLIDVKNKFLTYKSAQNLRITAENNLQKAKTDEDNLRHWLDELEKISPQANEEEELSQKRLEMMNSEKIIESLSYAYGALTQGCDITNSLRQAQSAIDKANRVVNGKYDEIYNALDRSLIEASDAISQIEEASNSVSLNQNELENIENRLFSLKSIARKHQVTIADLPQVMEDFRQKLNRIELGEDGITQLRENEAKAKIDYLKSATELSSKRKATAMVLDNKVMAELPPLKMEKAKFVTIIEKVEDSAMNENGFDNVYFTVATNPNSPQGPINKIASGGELARFMLALKVNLAQSSSVGTMIFDEVDAGVGGATAQAVGERLARLAQEVQVLIVTHSPQVAARGDNHFKVQKTTVDNITTTTVTELDIHQRHEEIARMLSGETITDAARAAAQSLIG